jgi:ankyrin repeat protein
VAVEARSRPAIGLLLKYGADVRSKDIYGRTPLDLAREVANRNRIIFDLLLEYDIKEKTY